MTDDTPAPTFRRPEEPAPSADPAAVDESSADSAREDGSALAEPVRARSVTENQPSPLPNGPVEGPLDDDEGPAVTSDPSIERAPVVAVASERGGAAPVDQSRRDAGPAPSPSHAPVGEPAAVAVGSAPVTVAERPEEPRVDESSADEPVRTRALPAAEPAESSRTERTEALRAETATAPDATVPTEVPRTVYVQALLPPKKKGNRLFAIVMSMLSTVVFALVWAGVAAIIVSVGAPERFGQSFSSFLTSWAFWLPVIGYALGMVLLSLVIGRGGWAWWLIGGFLVAVLVYFAYLGGAVLTVANQITAAEVQGFLGEVSLTPLAIGAAAAAREVSIWTGLAIAARGRKVKARNAEARAAFDREQADRREPQPA